MEQHNQPAVEGAWQPGQARLCPKCRTTMEAFDGADIKDRNYQGMLCPKCRWFKGSRSLGYGRRSVGARGDGKYDEPYEGKIRPRGT